MLYKMPENFEKWTKILVFFFLLSTSSSLHFISFIHSMHSIYNFDHICNVLAAYCWYSVSADENIWWHRLFSIKTTLPNFRSNTIVTRESRVSRVSGTHHQYTRYIHLIIGIWNLSVIFGYEYLVSFHRFPKETLRSSLKLEIVEGIISAHICILYMNVYAWCYSGRYYFFVHSQFYFIHPRTFVKIMNCVYSLYAFFQCK